MPRIKPYCENSCFFLNLCGIHKIIMMVRISTLFMCLFYTSSFLAFGENIDDNIREHAAEINPETICTFPESVLSTTAWMLDDRYAMLLMDDRSGFSLTVYDTQTLTPVSRFLHYGNGPREVLYPRVNIVNGNVLVNEFLKPKMYVIPCSEAMRENIDIQERTFEFTSARVIPFEDGFVALNPYWFENRKMRISNGEPKLFFSDGTQKPYDDSKPCSYNCIQGKLLYSSNAGRIAYIEDQYPLIEIYDASNLSLLHSISGPDKFMPDYKIFYNQIMFADIPPAVSYQSCCADDEYIYLLYSGIHDDNTEIRKSNGGMATLVPNTDTKDLLLLVLDWDGNLIKAFRPAGLTSYSELSRGSAPGIIYATTLDSDMMHLSILRFCLF